MIKNNRRVAYNMLTKEFAETFNIDIKELLKKKLESLDLSEFFKYSRKREYLTITYHGHTIYEGLSLKGGESMEPRQIIEIAVQALAICTATLKIVLVFIK